jgi:tRNA A37 threonylcarbamoyladenosine dehydratase
MASTSRPAAGSAGSGGGPPGLVASFVQSPKLVIAAVAVTSSLATAGALLATQRLSRKARRTDLEDSARRATAARLRSAEKHGAGRSTDVGGAAEEASTDGGTPRYLTNLAGSHHDFAPHLRPSPLRRSQSNQPYDESLVREQLARHYSFLGDEGMAALRGAFVVVVGAGGVGSACALSLLRAGVGALRLIDFDQVSLSSLNRHAVATLADVGRPKVVVCSEHFARIAPWAHVEAWVELFKGDEAPRLLGASRPVGRSADAKTRQPTYVIDAIDNLDTKVELLAYCYRQGIKCFSSMGAGAKCDPSRIQIADLTDTSEDPLSRHVRRKLRMMGIPSLGPEKEKKKKDSAAPEPAQTSIRKSILQGRDDVKPFEIPSRITLPKNEPKSRAPLVASPLPGGAAATSPRPPPSAWANDSSSRNRHMRRASSASSMGSAAYHTPLGTPMLEGEGSDDGKDADDTVRLPEAALADEEEDGQSPMPSLALPQAEHRDSLVEMSASPLPSPSPQISSLGAPKERNPLSRAASTAALAARQGSETEARPVRSKSKSKSSENAESVRLGIPVVFSTETKSDVRLLPLPEEEYQRGNVEELAVLNDFRVRVLPVLGEFCPHRRFRTAL